MPTLTADCSGLVSATVAISLNIDAVREELICLRQRFGEAFPTREYLVIRDQLMIEAMARQTEMLSRAILQLAAAVAHTSFPDLEGISFSTPESTDMGNFGECASTYYCPPGYIRVDGVCVPIEE
jgi:hypothetical protein